MLHIHAGDGVAVDSVPATGWEETINKDRSTFCAVTMAEKGLDRIWKLRVGWARRWCPREDDFRPTLWARNALA